MVDNMTSTKYSVREIIYLDPEIMNQVRDVPEVVEKPTNSITNLDTHMSEKDFNEKWNKWLRPETNIPHKFNRYP